MSENNERFTFIYGRGSEYVRSGECAGATRCTNDAYSPKLCFHFDSYHVHHSRYE